MGPFSPFELGIEGGTLVGPRGRVEANLYVADGQVAAISRDRLPCRQPVDVEGLLVMPGMVDAHVHLMDPGETDREDFPSGSAAAAVAGVTSLVEHTHSAPVRTPADLHAKRSYLDGRSYVDFGLGAHAWDLDQDLAALWDAGVSFFKVFTCATHGVPGWSYGSLLELFSSLSELGAPCLVHSEDASITAEQEAKLRETGRIDGEILPEWRHPVAEVVAISAVVRIADEVGARAVLAHVSSPDAIEVARRLGRPESSVLIESCPQYMELFRDEVVKEGAFRKFTPPARARTREDLSAMWGLLKDGSIDYLASDHAPSTSSQKRASGIWDAPFGLPGLDTTMPLLLNAAASGRITYERLVEVYSERPARVYGFYPRKGSLSVGADADVVVVDPDKKWTLSDDGLRSKAGWSPYSGREFVGRVVKTFVRGELVAEDGAIADEHHRFGQFIRPQGS